MLAARREAERRLAQLAADLEREEAHLAEAQASLTRLAEEQDAVTRAEAEDGPGRELTEAGLREAGACLAEAEAVLQRETEAVAAADARRVTLDRRRKDLEERRARLEARRAEAERQRAGLAAGAGCARGGNRRRGCRGAGRSADRTDAAPSSKRPRRRW